MNDIKCPQCGGNQFKNLGDSYKCLYCGTSFQPSSAVKQEQPVQITPTITQIPTNTSSNVNVTVNMRDQVQNNNSSASNTFVKGAAGGAGAVAGGCLTTTAIILAIPFIFFLALLSMCS